MMNYRAAVVCHARRKTLPRRACWSASLLVAASSCIIQTAAAQIMWQEGGVPAAGISTRVVAISLAEDGVGGTYIVWADTVDGSKGIFVQHLDIAGNRLWGENGIRIPADTGQQDGPRVVGDDGGGAIVVWTNTQVSRQRVLAQRLDPMGSPLWDSLGVQVCTLGYVTGITDVSASSFIVSFSSSHVAFHGIWLQRMSLDGARLWGSQGIYLHQTSENEIVRNYATLSDGAGGAYVGSEEIYVTGSPPYPQYYVNGGVDHITSGGSSALSLGLISGHTSGSMGWPEPLLSIVSAQSGNLIVGVMSQFGSGTYMMRKLVSDTLTWTPAQLSTIYGHQLQTVPTASGGVIGLVSQFIGRLLVVQRCDSTGPLWGTMGLVVDSSSRGAIVADDSSGAVVLFDALRAAWFRATGNVAWTVQLFIADDSLGSFIGVNDRRGGTVVAWTEQRGGHWGIYAQRLDTYTTPGVAEHRQVSLATPALCVTASPNPFHRRTALSWYLDRRSSVNAEVFSASGKLIRTLRAGVVAAGPVRMTWDGRDDRQNVVPRGLYFCRVEGGDLWQTAKIVKVE